METIKNTAKIDFVLKFGKFKGQMFLNTPQSYQDWLIGQSWFNMPQLQEKPLHQQLNGWDGYSRKGQSIYDAIFEQEKLQALKDDCKMEICTCCVDSMYYGM